MEFARADVGSTVWTLGGCHSWYQDDRGEATSMWAGTMSEYARLMARFEPAHHIIRPREHAIGLGADVTGLEAVKDAARDTGRIVPQGSAPAERVR